MKKLLLFCCALSTTAIFAQPTITGWVVPIPGQTDQSNLYDASLIASGPSGANVTWDFSSITSIGSGNAVYANPSASPRINEFPGTTLLAIGDGDTVYYKTNSNEMTLVGVGLAGVITDNYSGDPREFVKFPITYQTTFNETFDGTQKQPGLEYVRSGTIVIEGDGYGTLKMPYGDVSNVLRVKTTTSYGDTWMGTPIANYEETTYTWWHGANKGLLLSHVSFVTIVGGSPQPAVYSGNYLDETSVGIEDESFKPFDFSISPNPAVNQINITYEADSRENMNLELYDLSGRLVMENSIRSNGGSINEMINVNHLNAGMYTVMLRYNGGVISQKLMIR